MNDENDNKNEKDEGMLDISEKEGSLFCGSGLDLSHCLPKLPKSITFLEGFRFLSCFLRMLKETKNG